MTTFQDILARDGVLVYKTRGVSMEPMLRQNRDLVIIEVPSSRLHKYDVALYRRDKDYVLHRVIEVRETDYRIRGDNTYILETVPDSAIVGVLTGFQRKGRMYTLEDRGYQCYVRLWQVIFPLHCFFVRLCRLASVFVRKTGIFQGSRKTSGKGGRE